MVTVGRTESSIRYFGSSLMVIVAAAAAGATAKIDINIPTTAAENRRMVALQLQERTRGTRRTDGIACPDGVHQLRVVNIRLRGQIITYLTSQAGQKCLMKRG